MGGRAVRCPGLWGWGPPAVNIFLHPPTMLATVISSFPPQAPGTQLSPAGEGKAHGEPGVWRGGQGPGLRPRASALGRITRWASTTFCFLPCTGGRGPFSLIPDPSQECWPGPSPQHPVYSGCPGGAVGRGGLWPALSPAERWGLRRPFLVERPFRGGSICLEPSLGVTDPGPRRTQSAPERRGRNGVLSIKGQATDGPTWQSCSVSSDP